LHQYVAIGTGLVNGYRSEFQENGAAGVAGSLGFDVAMAALSGGISAEASLTTKVVSTAS